MLSGTLNTSSHNFEPLRNKQEEEHLIVYYLTLLTVRVTGKKSMRLSYCILSRKKKKKGKLLAILYMTEKKVGSSLDT